MIYIFLVIPVVKDHHACRGGGPCPLSITISSTKKKKWWQLLSSQIHPKLRIA